MNCLRLLSVVALSTLPIFAQEAAKPRTLAELRQHLAERFREAQKQEKPRQAVQAALGEQARELDSFLQHEAKGDDVHNGRLMLVDTYLNLGDRDKAKTALTGLDTDKAPALALIAGAQLAQVLGLKEQRQAWVDAAISKPAPFADRMALGMHLMTVLREVKKGDKIFQDALDAAKDDEERSEVRWYQVAALREREDRDDEAYYRALDELGKELPKTTWGGIARDRVQAAEHAVGKPPVPLTLTTTDGKTLSLASLHGKVVVLDFGASWSEHADATADFLLELHGKHADQGLQIVSISLDDNRAEFDTFVQRKKLPWHKVCDGRGYQTHAALRYNVEGIPVVMVLDKKGLIAGFNLLPTEERDRKRIDELIGAALARD